MPTLPMDKIQQIVDSANEGINEASVRKGRGLLSEIRSLDEQIKRLETAKAKVQSELVSLEWNNVTVQDAVGAAATNAPTE